MVKGLRGFVVVVGAMGVCGAAFGQATTRGGDGVEVGLWRMEDSKTKLWGYVDAGGKWVIPAKYKEAGAFVGEWAGVAVGVKGSAVPRHGVIDKKGREVVAPVWVRPVAFGEGVAVVPTSEKYEAYSYVDGTGKALFGQTFVYGQAFSEGLAWAMTADYLRGYMNREGKFVILNAKTEEVGGPFEEGRAVVTRNDGMFRVIDAAGAEVFKGKGRAGVYSEGMLAFEERGKWGFYDKAGKVVVEAKYLEAGDFHEGLAAVQEEGGLGYIDATGKVVVETTLSRADAFAKASGGVVAVAGREGMVGMIDGTGKWVVEPVFVEGDGVVEGRAVMTQMVTPTEKRMRLVEAGEKVTLNPQGVVATPELLGMLSGDVEGLPRTFAGVDKLNGEQKGKLQAAFGLIDSKKMVEGVVALEGLRKQKVTAASVVLGRMYQLGIGVKADAEKAAACYLEGAVGKDGFAMLEYGRLRYGGPAGVRNLPDGLAALVRASEGKDASAAAALRYLAFVSLEGKVVEVNVKGALGYAERAAKLGDARAGEAAGMIKKLGSDGN